MNDSRDFQDAESVRSGHSHVTSQLVCFPPHPVLGGMLTHMVYRETFFANPAASSSAPYPQDLNPWSSHVSEPFTHHRRGRMRIKHQFRIRDASLDRQPKIQSSLVREIPQKNYGADQQRLQISDLHFDKFTTPATFACWKIRFQDRGMYLFTISHGSDAMDQGSGSWLIQWMN